VVNKFIKFCFTSLGLLPSSLENFIQVRTEQKSVSVNIGWLLFDKIFRMGLGLLIGAWIARYLGPMQYGQLNFVISFVSIFVPLVHMGINTIATRDILLYPEASNKIISSALIMQIFSGLIYTVLVIFIMILIKPADESIQILSFILSPTLILKSTESIKSWFEAQVKTKYVVWLENSVFAFMSILRVETILRGASLEMLAWLMLIEALILSVGHLWIFKYHNRTFKLTTVSLKSAKTILYESAPLLLAGIAVMLYMRIDVIMLEFMTNSREVGIYSVATRISEILYFIPAVIVSSVSPGLIKLHKYNKSHFMFKLQQLYFLLFWLSAIGSLTIFALSESFINFIFGSQYSESTAVLSIHLWSSIAVFIGVASSQYLLVERLLIYSLYRTLIGLIINVALNFLLIPLMGAKGSALATLISYFFSTYSLLLFKETRQHGIIILKAPFMFRNYTKYFSQKNLID